MLYIVASIAIHLSLLNSDKKIQLNPILTAFVRRYSLIPAASVPSEAAFSIANFIQRKERSVMSSKMLRISMIMKECLEPLHSDYLNETK